MNKFLFNLTLKVLLQLIKFKFDINFIIFLKIIIEEIDLKSFSISLLVASNYDKLSILFIYFAIQ